ncbi:sugar ABC transporter ATP-binding protein [Clostridium kluyveri]|uniref:sugar ABC transporter ATP-binding protein n=1 Tax=Clostridium kluyveri TaxID=1534 RepID=UPI0022461C9F|nr:sugar ABC transporter ATP-binding protein [Clostridium kluyveri]UZQ50450.1 sugar ABC transporter ATP-binding protein [Clostridium kluyveri]
MSEEYILEMINIQKEFPGVKALENVTLQIRNAEIHGIVGENGAGKSTLMKILAGIYSQDSGQIKFNGEIKEHLTTKIVDKMKIHFIHQERYIVPHLTVAESLFLGIEPTYSHLKLLNRKSMEKEAEVILKEKLGIVISGNRLMGNLTVGEQQLIQICRALLNDPKIIVFDEPTAVLPKQEADRLFSIIRELGKKIAVIYISHYLGEVLDLCHRITVLRNGTKVKTMDCNGLEVKDIVVMMIGRNIENQFPPKKRWKKEVLLNVKGLTHSGQFTDVSFQVHSGEIIGITGLMGSGHTDVGKAIYDSSGIVGGAVEFNGRQLLKNSPEKSVALGIAYIPEDRRKLGVIQNMSVRENITISSLKKISDKGIINNTYEHDKVHELIEKLGIRTFSQETVAGLLSGGNQQKVAIGKWLNSDSKLFILNELTSGVDVGAKVEIYSIISEMAEQGAGIILISQDIQELVGLSDRILVMYRGKVINEFDGNSITTNEVFISMMGGNKNDSIGSKC